MEIHVLINCHERSGVAAHPSLALAGEQHPSWNIGLVDKLDPDQSTMIHQHEVPTWTTNMDKQWLDPWWIYHELPTWSNMYCGSDQAISRSVALDSPVDWFFRWSAAQLVQLCEQGQAQATDRMPLDPRESELGVSFGATETDQFPSKVTKFGWCLREWFA